MTTFLPADYTIPSGPSNYMKFEKGSNKFRILASPIIGYEGWKDKRPIRKRTGQTFLESEVDNVEEVKHECSKLVSKQ